jgi:hypothetical protein
MLSKSPAIPDACRATSLTASDREFAQGDRIQFTAPDRNLHVANRELATVKRIKRATAYAHLLKSPFF